MSRKTSTASLLLGKSESFIGRRVNCSVSLMFTVMGSSSNRCACFSLNMLIRCRFGRPNGMKSSCRQCSRAWFNSEDAVGVNVGMTAIFRSEIKLAIHWKIAIWLYHTGFRSIIANLRGHNRIAQGCWPLEEPAHGKVRHSWSILVPFKDSSSILLTIESSNVLFAD